VARPQSAKRQRFVELYVLAYSLVSGGMGGWGWIFMVLGFVFDIGHWVGGGVTGRQRYASA
jgi:hypothetical protein